MSFTRIHSSGLYSVPVSILEKALKRFRGRASLITMTEVDGARGHALNAPGWLAVHGKTGDAASLGVAVDKTVWRVVDHYEALLTKKRYVREGGATAPANEALVVVLYNLDEQKTLLIILGHYPAHVEGHSGPFGIWLAYFRSEVSQNALKGLKRELKKARKKYKPDAIILDGDFNLNIERADVRAFFKALFPAFTPNWRVYSGLGTLGKRFIDIGFLRHLRVLKGPQASNTPSSDHRYYEETLEFVPRRSLLGGWKHR